MFKVSVITPTIRKDGLELVRKSLEKQTFKNWEWLIGSKFDPEIPEARWIKDDFKGGFWTFNRMCQKLIDKSTGDIIVSWQDFIHTPSTSLQKFVDKLTEVGHGSLISAVGDQYSRLNKYGKPELKIWSDPRKTNKYGTFYESYHNDIEWNFGTAWKSDIETMGGLDTSLDFLGLGCGFLQLTDRMNDLGYKFYLDQTNETFTLRHDRSDFGGQEEWDLKQILFKKGTSGKSLYEERKEEMKSKGLWPVLS